MRGYQLCDADESNRHVAILDVTSLSSQVPDPDLIDRHSIVEGFV